MLEKSRYRNPGETSVQVRPQGRGHQILRGGYDFGDGPVIESEVHPLQLPESRILAKAKRNANGTLAPMPGVIRSTRPVLLPDTLAPTDPMFARPGVRASTVVDTTDEVVRSEGRRGADYLMRDGSGSSAIRTTVDPTTTAVVRDGSDMPEDRLTVEPIEPGPSVERREMREDQEVREQEMRERPARVVSASRSWGGLLLGGILAGAVAWATKKSGSMHGHDESPHRRWDEAPYRDIGERRLSRDQARHEVELFAGHVKQAMHFAKIGNCHVAIREREMSDDSFRRLFDALPKLREEMSAKLDMVDDVIAECETR